MSPPAWPASIAAAVHRVPRRKPMIVVRCRMPMDLTPNVELDAKSDEFIMLLHQYFSTPLLQEFELVLLHVAGDLGTRPRRGK